MTYSVLQQAAETRRSIYALNNTLPLSNEEVTKIIEHAVCIRRLLSIRNLPEWSYCLAKNMPKCGILSKKRCVRLFLPSSLKPLHKN